MQAIEELFHNYPQMLDIKEQIMAAFEVMRQCYLAKKKLLLCGNGSESLENMRMY